MSLSPVVSLRKAMRERLLADTTLVSALGGPKVHDVAPRDAQAPWIAFADTKLRDWSTVSGRGVECLADLVVVSDQPGQREALELAEQVSRLLDDAPLALAGWRLVRLACVATDARRAEKDRFARVTLRFRALIEA
ncbi:MAG: DUF3168 domain-containing protein [Rhodoblastus sp.]|nr:MAG: DUF3168 domain-containing protein [Rhodoblastus sp.]